MSSSPSATDLEKPPMGEDIKPADLIEPVGEDDVGIVEEYIDTKAEKKLLRKLDVYLLVLFGCVYCMNTLGSFLVTQIGQGEINSNNLSQQIAQILVTLPSPASSKTLA